MEALTTGAAGERLREAVMQQMRTASADAKLAGFEIAKQIVLDPEMWSVENNLLTPTFKMKRVELKKRLGRMLDACALPLPLHTPPLLTTFSMRRQVPGAVRSALCCGPALGTLQAVEVRLGCADAPPGLQCTQLE